MALAETAKLIAQLSLDDRMSAGLKKAGSNLGRFEGSLNRAGQGVKTAAGNIAKFGVIAGAGVALAVRSGIANLAELESAVSSVDGAIKQMGLTGQVTGAQIAGWANEIEASVGAAFDDKEITAAAANLIRFGKVVPANLRPSLQVMTDLAVKTGSIESASSLLAKALADPAKAAGRLTRVGVILTKSQQDMIKTMTDAGDAAGAQALLLDILAKSTDGAAAASQGPYARAMSVLADVTEDAQKALAEGFLPVLEKVSGLLSSELAKPSTMNAIRDFGKDLAGGLDDLIGIAQKLPWGVIGESLRTAGAGAKILLDAFTGMPPWVQTAVITGWGLNKLTGGAVGDIAGELGKGLVKGVLGMNAGVVNITAGVVNGAGGVPGSPVGAAAGGMGRVATAATFGAAGVGSVAGNAIGTTITDWITDILPAPEQAKTQANDMARIWLDNALPTPGSIQKKFEDLFSFVQGKNPESGTGQQADTSPTSPAAIAFRDAERASHDTTTAVIDAGDTFDRATGLAKTANVAALASVGNFVTSGTGATTSAVYSSAATISAAMNSIPPPIVNVSVETNVTASDIVKTTVSKDRQGPQPSRNGGQTWGGGP